jgi:hypothetical protein
MGTVKILQDKRVQLGLALGAFGVISFVVYVNRKKIGEVASTATEKIVSATKTTKAYSKQIINYLGQIGQATKAPRGIKNNNPGNINKTTKDGKPYLWNGEVPHEENTDSRFKQFYDFAYGVRALMLNLKAYFKNGKDSVRKIISTWAPASENKESTEAYINYVAGQLKVKPDSTLLPTEKTLSAIAKAIAKFENGTSTEWVSDATAKKAYSLLT